MIIEQPARFLRWLYPHALWRMNRRERAVYLTFDDGPIPKATPWILDVLDRFDAKATFFMVGENANRYPELLAEVLFRPPHGWMRVVQYRTMRIFGYKVVMWDLVTRDYSTRLTAQDVLDNVKHYARNGSIITFHDSLKSIDKLKVMLPEALQWLKDQGYEFKKIEY